MPINTSAKSSLSLEAVASALDSVVDPVSGKGVMSAGMISHLQTENGKISFVITVAPDALPAQRELQAACEQAVRKLEGVMQVTAVLTAHHETPPSTSPAMRKAAHWNRDALPHVKKIIAVASGKGGVGKSTVAVNLALALAQMGKRVGLLDADMYGPSVPRMLGVTSQPNIQDGHMLPLQAYGVKTLSMGLITGDQTAVLRAPMVTKALTQMLRLTFWGSKKEPLDILLVDMPPGTGDIHLSLVQQVPVDGAVIVTTPQEIALADARKCADMFTKTGVPILGVVENMSWFCDPAGNRHNLFGEGGGEQLASEFHTILLGQLPLEPGMREAADTGQSYPRQQPQSEPVQTLARIARLLL